MSTQPLRVGVIGAGTVGREVVRAFLEGSTRLTPADGRPLVLSRYARTAFATLLVMGIIAVQSVMTSPAPAIVYKDF